MPVENAAMPERTVIQWDKDDLDALGLLKVDVLGLGMLAAIRRAFDLVHGFRGQRWTLATVPAEDPARLRHDRPRRHGGRLPDRVARADGDAAAAAAALVLRPRDRGRDHPARPDPGRHGASVPAPARGRGGGHVSQRGSGRRAEAHARRADLPGAGDAARDRRGGIHAGRGRPAAARDGGVEAQGRARPLRGAADPRHARRAATPRSSRGASSSRSSASANTASRSRTRRASRCWCTSRRGSSGTSPRPSPLR